MDMTKVGVPGSLITPTTTQIHFKPGELTQEELRHAINVTNFQKLVWYAKEMNSTGCTYKKATISVNKRGGYSKK